MSIVCRIDCLWVVLYVLSRGSRKVIMILAEDEIFKKEVIIRVIRNTEGRGGTRLKKGPVKGFSRSPVRTSKKCLSGQLNLK